jgi:hypothetical protein
MTDVAGRERLTGARSPCIGKVGGGLIAWLNQARRLTARRVATSPPGSRTIAGKDLISVHGSLEGALSESGLVEAGLQHLYRRKWMYNEQNSSQARCRPLAQRDTVDQNRDSSSDGPMDCAVVRGTNLGSKLCV